VACPRCSTVARIYVIVSMSRNEESLQSAGASACVEIGAAILHSACVIGVRVSIDDVMLRFCLLHHLRESCQAAIIETHHLIHPPEAPQSDPHSLPSQHSFTDSGNLEEGARVQTHHAQDRRQDSRADSLCSRCDSGTTSCRHGKIQAPQEKPRLSLPVPKSCPELDQRCSTQTRILQTS
jgi:hypothetical protein